MNGDLGKIYALVSEVNNKLTKVETTEKLHHEENRRDLDVLFAGFRSAENKPCKQHAERMRWIWIILGSFIGGTVSVFLFLFKLHYG